MRVRISQCLYVSFAREGSFGASCLAVLLLLYENKKTFAVFFLVLGPTSRRQCFKSIEIEAKRYN